MNMKERIMRFMNKKKEMVDLKKRSLFNKVVMSSFAITFFSQKSYSSDKSSAKTEDPGNLLSTKEMELEQKIVIDQRNLFGNIDGSRYIGRPKNVKELTLISPSAGLNIKVDGFLTKNDGGEGYWYYDPSDLSEKVNIYPNIFIAPQNDLSGKSGAWRISHKNQIESWRYGVGSFTDNKKIIEEIDRYNVDLGYDILLPSRPIFCSSLNLVSNKFKGVMSAVATKNGGLGTALIFDDSETTDDCITITRGDNRMTGLLLENITVIGKDFFTNRKNKTKRRPWNIVKIGGQVDIKNIFTIGFSLSAIFDELWDGSVVGWRMLYCGTDRLSPALWLGSTSKDNTNALHFWGLHIEHSPYMLHCDFVRHVQIHSSKFESGDSGIVTAPLITLGERSQEINFVSVQFITNSISSDYFIEDKGSQSTYIGCWFNSRNASATDKYPGILWFNGKAGVNHKFAECRFTRCRTGNETLPYPFVLGDYDTMSSCSIFADDSSNYGIYSIGSCCKVNNLVFIKIINNTTESDYGFYLCRGENNDIRHYIRSNLDSNIKLVTGNKNNKFVIDNVNYLICDDTSEINAEGVGLIFANVTNGNVEITKISGMIGSQVSISTNSDFRKIIFNENIFLKEKKDVILHKNSVISFMCVAEGKFIEVNRNF